MTSRRAIYILGFVAALAATRGTWALEQANPRHVVPASDATTYVSPMGDVGITILLDRESVGSDAALSLGTFLPGSGVPEHVHEESAEILYILNGEMEMTIGTERLRAAAGSAVYIPAGTPHSATVLGSIESVKVVQVYAPGGPEQRFKDWAPAAREW